ncbi:hypothetical protein LBYZC6_33670 [Lacrimispora brassicae]
MAHILASPTAAHIIQPTAVPRFTLLRTCDKIRKTENAAALKFYNFKAAAYEDITAGEITTP